jgi:hypothetical protein
MAPARRIATYGWLDAPTSDLAIRTALVIVAIVVGTTMALGATGRMTLDNLLVAHLIVLGTSRLLPRAEARPLSRRLLLSADCRSV